MVPTKQLYERSIIAILFRFNLKLIRCSLRGIYFNLKIISRRWSWQPSWDLISREVAGFVEDIFIVDGYYTA